MTNALTIIDNFFEQPESIRQFALSHDFTQAPEFDGHKYEHFAPVKDPRFCDWLAIELSAVIGHDVAVRIATFTCLQEGQGTQQWIHSDNVCASHAAVVYLFDKPGYGTSFWRHNQLGQDYFYLREMDSNVQSQLVMEMREAGKTTAAWTETDRANSEFNRLIFYPSTRFHSRSIEHGFGSSPETARLTLAVFFDIL